MTDALVAFLKARLDDDERVARAVGFDGIESEPFLWSSSYLILRQNTGGESKTTSELDTELAAHIARQDPARTLREVEAKRRLLDAALADHHHVSADQYETCPRATAVDGLDAGTLAALEDLNDERRQEDGVEPKCWDSCGRDARVRRTLELLALPYSDHPGCEEAVRS
ncbi:hypothetical protein J7F02_34565 [Streptomyces sp. ISL-112]|uniref:DUF6221 family protein n=1 Tax=unclassified Streptomyces TaxID=2593676 RepID=UPI001BEBC0AC|nr:MULTISPECIES: DUF6221 family protein [unclassified Streptomyces]MBT2430561.1 hypothetical protein [Streptomyces sp. ISL-112]MBT2465851.1 hypothetical protein [Streptomyces sp. ISL-63]